VFDHVGALVSGAGVEGAIAHRNTKKGYAHLFTAQPTAESATLPGF